MKRNVIYQIIELLQADTYYGVSPEIEMIKGRNKIKENWKERFEQFKRNLFFHKNN